MENSRFTFFENYWDFMKLMGDADVAAMVRAICGYAFDGVEPELEGTCALLWIAIRPNVDASLKAAQSGSAGGRGSQKSDANACKNQPSNCCSKAPSNGGSKAPSNGGSKAPSKGGYKAPSNGGPNGVAQDACDGAEAPLGQYEEKPERGLASERKGIGIGEGEGKGVGDMGAHGRVLPRPDGPEAFLPDRAAFRPPTPGEVSEYLAASTLPPIDAERFCDYHASTGWRKGGQQIEDWRPLARSWARTEAARDKRPQRPGKGEVMADERAVEAERAQFRAV